MEEKSVDTKEQTRPQREYGHKYHLLNTIKHRGKPIGMENEELVGTDPEKRNWKGIIIAVLVILIVFAFIGIAVYFVQPRHGKTEVGEPFEFDQLFDKNYKPRKVDARWLPGRDVFVYRSRDGEVLARDPETDSPTLIMDNSTFIHLDSDVYFVSADLQFVLVAHKVQKMYRHSFLAEYKIYNRNATEPSNRLIKFPQDINEGWQEKKLQYAGWSASGHSLTFVYENNLYYQKDPFSTPVKVTQTGSDSVMNGVPDWLYEEEVLHSHAAHWFSPGSTYVCYAQTNDTAVPTYTFPWYGNPHQVNSGFRTVRYPKAGDEGSDILPVLKLYVLNTGSSMSRTHKELEPPPQLANQERYMTRVQWLSDETLVVVWSNRPQNVSYISHYNARTEDFYLNYIQKSTGGWVEIPKIMPVDAGERYVTILPHRDFNSEYYKHLAVTTISIFCPVFQKTDNKEGSATFLTKGSYDVTDLVGYDAELNYVYYISTNSDPRNRHLFRAPLLTSSQARPGMKLPAPQCLTCGEEDCTYVRADFSPSGKHYVLHCDGPGVPYTLLRGASGTDIVLEDNALLCEKMNGSAQPVVENFTLQAEDGNDIYVRVLFPPVLNKEHITLYPMLVHTYGAPGTQKVTSAYTLDWGRHLVTKYGVISVEIDGRGAGGRGEKVQHALYKRLGTFEVQDQIHVAEYLRDKYSFIDKDRIAIWGWSYGGFVAAHAVGDPDSDVFTCGIAVAPVTDWRYYDAAYTEKYMGLASETRHYVQYNRANVSMKAPYFRGKRFMMVHGTADDNVHFQHSAQLGKALTSAEDVDFRTQVYTDENHSLSGDKTRRHLYRTMASFLQNTCWGGGKPREMHKGEFTEIDISELAARL